MKSLLIFVNTIFFSIGLLCQSSIVEGVVQDDQSVGLIGATVVVLDQADTTMVAFGITDDSGQFRIYDVLEGDYLLQLSYTGYKDEMIAFTKGSEKKIFEEVTMVLATELLEEVSIKAEHIPMGILGDTINYNAAAFKTRPGASVEDLLKKLPGIEVSRDGNIKAQGEDVESVLVDGKEFFSGDPTIATKNLDAEAVDKVQVFDKQSDEAEFTGIEDSNAAKTINLKLKEGYKSGGFGRVEVNGGTDNVRLAKGNYSRFSTTTQTSIIANSNNINQQAFSFQEYIEFMGGFQNLLASNGGSEINKFSNPEATKGINSQNSVGTNLNYSKSEKLKFNANYLFAGSDNDLIDRGNTETFTDDINFLLVDTTVSNNITNNHRLNTKLKLNPSSKTNVVWDNRLFGIFDNQVRTSQSQFLQGGMLTNETGNELDLESKSLSLKSNLTFRRKFEKKGRNLSLRGGYEFQERNEFLDLESDFFAFGSLSETIQQQSFRNNQQIGNARFSFTEPFGKKRYIGFHLNFLSKTERPVREYFDREGESFVFGDDLSGEFSKDWTSSKVGLFIKRNRKKLKLNAGLDLQYAMLDASDNGISLNDFQGVYWLPSASSEWSLSGSKRIELGYTTSIKEPAIGQMVNQVNNTNPNFIILGNSNLVPEYSHTISFRYNYFDSFNFSSLFWNLSFVYSPNKIVNSRSFIDDVRTESQPINSSSFNSIVGYINYATPIRKLKMKISIENVATYLSYQTFVQDQTTNFKNAQFSTKLILENRSKDIVDIAGGVDFNLSAFGSDVSSNFDNPFFTYNLFIDGFVELGKGWSFSSKYDLRTYSAVGLEDQRVVNLLGAALQKTFLTEKLTIKLSSFDLLGQNIGLDRTGNINALSINQYNTLGRYFMVGASYKLG